jgi:LmbE family N-acetylglucosaminyl deacetylase
MEPLVLLTVTAHPGDELAIAGTLARHAAAGVRVELACATRGEIGQVPDGQTAGERAAAGERNLRCACARLGVAEVHFLGYHDAGLCGDRRGPGTLPATSACDVVRKLVHLIRHVRPQVMVTFGPDGVNGHVDHVTIGGLAAQAFGAAPDVEEFPRDGGPEPYAPAHLFYFGLPEGLLRLAAIPGVGTPDAAIAAREDVSLFVDVKIDAARCYGMGLEPQLSKLFQLPQPERHHLLGTEFFTLAQPQPAVDDRRDPRLFAGIP